MVVSATNGSGAASRMLSIGAVSEPLVPIDPINGTWEA